MPDASVKSRKVFPTFGLSTYLGGDALVAAFPGKLPSVALEVAIRNEIMIILANTAGLHLHEGEVPLREDF